MTQHIKKSSVGLILLGAFLHYTPIYGQDSIESNIHQTSGLAQQIYDSVSNVDKTVTIDQSLASYDSVARFSETVSLAQLSASFDSVSSAFETITLEQLSASLYLNDCIATLTRIQRSKSKLVLTEEQFILNNALRWDGDFTKYKSLFIFRNSLQDELNDMLITDGDRQRFKDAFDKKKNGAARDAILGAVSGIQFNPNLFALASNVVLKSAQTFLDYNKKMGEYDEELDKDMWQLEQKDMNCITNLRKEAFSILYELFQDNELHFREDLRLVENDFENLFNYIELSSDIKIDKMLERMSKFKYLPLYWYELGKSYVDLYEVNKRTDYLEKAFDCFDKYKFIVSKCKLYRFDYNLGNIALYELEYKHNLTTRQKYQLLDVVRDNLSNDGNALLFVAMYYINELSNINKGINLLCDCLTDKNMSEHNDMLLYLSIVWDKINSSQLKEKISRSVLNSTNIDMLSYIGFLYRVRNDKTFDSYALFHELQKGIILIPKNDENGDVIKYSLCSESQLLRNDFDNWNASMEEINFEEGIKYASSFYVDFIGKDKKKYFTSLDDLASKEEYFKFHRDKRDIIKSQVKLGGQTYYYLSKDKTWEVVKPLMNLQYKGGRGINDRDVTTSAEKEYYKFYDKYHVEEVNFIFVKNEDSIQESDCKDCNSAKYTFILVPTPISNNSGGTITCKLLFITDYMDGRKTDFYFDGIVFGNNYVKI